MRVAVEGKLEASKLVNESKLLRKSGPDLQAATTMLGRLEAMRGELEALISSGRRLNTALTQVYAESVTMRALVRHLTCEPKRQALEAERRPLHARLYVSKGQEHLDIIARLSEIKEELAGLK